MQVKQIKQDGLKHELEITISANDIDARVDDRLKEVGKTMRLPGFRPGKVPLNILKKRYGKAVMGEVLEAAVNESSAKAMQDKKIKPALQPKIEVKEFDEGKDLVYSMAVEALPEFKIMDLKTLKLEKLVAKVADDEVQKALERVAQSNPVTQEVTSGRAAKEGDTVVIDFDGRTAEDDVRHPGMKASGHHLKLGSGMFIPGFEEQLVGQKKGADVAVKVKFPEAYGAQHLAGKDAIFDVKVSEIREVGEPKFDDEFAKNLGFDTLDAVKKAIREQLEREYEGQARLTVKKDLLDKLDAEHDFEIPATLVDLEFQNIMDQIEYQRRSMTADQSESSELSEDEKAEYRQISERRVRLGLLLAEIGNQNKITVADPELQKAVIAEAQKYPGQEREVFDYYANNRQALESLRAPLFEDKVVDFILALANVTEKTVSAEELAKALGDDSEEEADSKSEKKASKKPAAKKSSSKAKKAS